MIEPFPQVLNFDITIVYGREGLFVSDFGDSTVLEVVLKAPKPNCLGVVWSVVF
jgi:hypothetical protein